MSDPLVKIGIDYRDGLFYVARVDHRSGRPEVKALVRFEREHFGFHPLLEGGEIIFSVPDDRAVAKRLVVSENGRDVTMKVRFELIQSVLEDEAEFYFDVIPTARPGCYLGLMIRREQLRAEFENLVKEPNGIFPDARYELRAAGLGKCYLGFCRRSGGELVSLVDFNGGLLSVAFLYREKLIDLSHMRLDKFDFADESNIEKMAVEMKTLINYRLSMLFSEGITVPLSALLVAGDRANQATLKTLRKFFSIDTGLPQINPGFFSNPSALGEIPLEKYAVALGLAVK